jgi:L-2,4-diaminobutyrate decarboxylase
VSSPPRSIRDAYDPARFRADGHRLIDALADTLAAAHARRTKVVPWREPAEARAAWAAQPLQGGADLVDELVAIAAASTTLASPRCFAHQVPPPLPGAVLAETVSALLNNGMAVAEMGPAATPIELAVIDWLCAQLGMPSGAGGVLTSGGSLGNLTALLAMRQAQAGWNAWADGAHGGPPLAVITSTDAHYSISRALAIMGWGQAGAVAAKVDAAHLLTPVAVERALDDAIAAGRRPIGICAAAGSTATGAFDPLDELADLAAARQLWLHVDAAHGGGVAVSAKHRHLLRGIERADSVVWDAHKLLMMPALVTAVLFKDGARAYDAFAQQASYLFAPQPPWWDLGTRTLECTKRMMAIELWTALRVHGPQLFADVIDRLFELAQLFAAKLAAAPDFELALPPMANIVCYRYRPVDGPSRPGPVLDALQRALRAAILADGTCYVVGTQLPGGDHLRSTLMNPLAEPRDLDDLLAHIREIHARG